MIAVRAGLESWGAVTRELVDEIVAPDVEVTIRDLPDAPVTSIMSAHDCDLAAPYNVQAAIQAERDGFDAITTGCLLDPGIEAMKEAVDKLVVVGDCEAVMHLGSLLGRRICVLLPNKITSGLITFTVFEDLVRKYGFRDKLVSIRGVQSTSLDFAAERDDLPGKTLAQARLAVEEDRADVIVGYGSLAVINHLRANLAVPVLESVQCTLSLATELVRHRSR
jgi:allantoin racemase